LNQPNLAGSFFLYKLLIKGYKMLEIILLAAVLIAMLVFGLLFIKALGKLKFDDYNSRLDKNEASIKDEFARNRDEISKSAKDSREEIQKTIINFTSHLDQNFEKVRDTVEKKLSDIQKDSNDKLEKIRETVDEKLHKTLETRLGESFKLVSQRLEEVQRGLGEMQQLASGVGELRKVLSNVKTKGVLGEYQLASILEQVLTPNQYVQNVKTKETSAENVEFAIKIPSKEDSDKSIFLPIDAKFPTADYEMLMQAYDLGDVENIKKCKKSLSTTIENFARDIRDKYVNPPITTDFAIMYLPFEGLYAEVLRIVGLFEKIQREYKITITGPTTIAAFLNSLQMGFRTLVIEKRTSEIWNLLGAVKTEFGQFGDILQKTKEKLEGVSREIDKAGVRSRAIERKLRDVQELPESEADKLL
jgi:DNA recombination protein RmuC